MEEWTVHLLINQPVLLFVVLATVVIGGLITSTLLTLLILPTLYTWFEKNPEGALTKE